MQLNRQWVCARRLHGHDGAKTCGAFGGVIGADATVPPVALVAVKVPAAAGMGAQTLPSVYLTPETRALPEASLSPAEGTSAARLNSLTLLPVLGGTKEAAQQSCLDS